MKNESSLGDYIGGRFLTIKDANGEVWSRNPANLGAPKIEFPFTYKHVNEAVEAAHRAFYKWRQAPFKEVAQYLQRYYSLLSDRKEALALQITHEVGKPLWEARLEIDETLQSLLYFQKTGRLNSYEVGIDEAKGTATGVVRFSARGIMAIITPATMPVFGLHLQLLPALIHGDCVIVKASKHAPFVGQMLAQMIHDAGFPSGVFNLIQGDGEMGRRLASHPDVEGVFFTGSYETAMRIRKQLVSDYWKLLVIETGGKNAAVAWNDCDIEKTVRECLWASFLTCGQRTTSTSRILVHEKIFDRFLGDFHKLAKRCSVGPGSTDEKQDAFIGPLISEEAQENYLRFQGIAVREGAEEIMRGKILERNQKGYFVSPSLHVVTQVDAKSIYQTSEIFGPNVAFYKFSDFEEANQILNLTKQGLVASFYSEKKENYLKVLQDAEVGILHWNRSTVTPSYMLPFGGIKQSGSQRPMGSFAGYQCTYPMSSIEAKTPATLTLPPCFPALEE